MGSSQRPTAILAHCTESVLCTLGHSYGLLALDASLGLELSGDRSAEMIGSDFIERVESKLVYCSECGRKIRPGEKSLCSMRGGKVIKRVCSEECRKDFDDAFWQSVAYERSRSGPA
jgi:hypothetical protein